MRGRDTLDVFDFGLLFQALAHSLKVGSLRVTSGKREKYICLNRGRVDGVYTRRTRVRIGKVLYNMRAVSREDLKAVLAEQREALNKVPLGQDLLARGLIGPDDLEGAVRYQMIEEILEIFDWSGVRYEFFGGPPEKALRQVPGELFRVGGAIEADDLLLQVTKLLDDLRKYDEALPSHNDVYVLVPEPEEVLSRTDLQAGTLDIVELLDGRRDVKEVLRTVRLNRFGALDALYRLRKDDLIRAKTGAELFDLANGEQDKFSSDRLGRIYERMCELGVEDSATTLQVAEAFERLGDSETAAENYRVFAVRMLEEEDFASAEAALSRAIAVQPAAAELRRLRSRLMRSLGRGEEAVTDLRVLASIYRENGEPRREELALRRAMRIAPEDRALTIAHAEVLSRLGRKREGGNLCVALASRLLMGWEFDGAEEAQRGAVRIDPDRIRYRSGLVRILADRGDPDRAMAAFHELLRVTLMKVSRRPHHGLWALRALTKRLEALGGEDSPAMMMLAASFIEQEATDDAVAVLTAAGEAQLAGGRMAEAAETLGQAISLAPESELIHQRLAVICEQVDSPEQAAVHLGWIARRQREKGLAGQAEVSLRKILEINPYSPETLEELAEILAEQGKNREAAVYLARVGHLHQGAARNGKSIHYYDLACGLDPSNPDHARALADALGDVLEMDRSLESYRHLAMMLAKKGENAGAIDAALRILDLDSDRPDVVEILRAAYEALGDQIRAAAGELFTVS